MKSIRLVKAFSIGVIILAFVSATVGLFWQTGGEPFWGETIRGESVKLYGNGLYMYDTYSKAPINRGTDAVTLFVAIPLLIFAIVLIRKKELKGMLLTAGALSYFLYYSVCLAFGVSYNLLFPVYLLMFSLSLFAFITCISSLSNVDFFSKASAKLPYRGIAIFLIVAGLSVTVWLFEIIGAVISGVPPITLGIYTSEPTFVIDLGIIAPTAFASAVMILRRKSLGYIGAAILLTLNSLIGIVVISQTIAQNLAGITIGVGQIIAYVGVFVVMGSFAVGLNIRLFRNIIN